MIPLGLGTLKRELQPAALDGRPSLEFNLQVALGYGPQGNQVHSAVPFFPLNCSEIGLLKEPVRRINSTEPRFLMRTTRCFFCTANGRQISTAGFSFADLLAVFGVVALVGLIQLSALANNKGNSHRAMCTDNLRRLALSWLMYADDNRGRLVPNGFDAFPSTNNWVAGWLDFSPRSDNTNLTLITRARLYPYNKAVEIYRCPDDLSGYRGLLRVRSYSMNSWVGESATGWLNSPDEFEKPARISQIRQPDQTFVFIEEHPDSIDDGTFFVDMHDTGPSAYIIDFPAAFHYLGANLSFADGSVRFRQWIDARTMPAVRNASMLLTSLRHIPQPDQPLPLRPDAVVTQFAGVKCSGGFVERGRTVHCF